MDQSVRIILQFVDQASVPLAGASATITKALTGLKIGAIATVGTIGRGFGNLVGVVGGALGRIGGFVTNAVSHFRWASLFVGVAMVGITKSVLDTAANVEQTKVAFETLLGSKPEAGNLLEWITQLSIKTPFTRIQIQDLTRTMLAYGHSSEQAKTATLAVVEATSALGISETRLQAISYNLGQIAASTTVSYREFRDIQKQGINTGTLLAKAVKEGNLQLSGWAETVDASTGKLADLTREQQEAILKQNTGISIATALEEQMLKTYGGAALRQVKTMAGAVSNFGDVFQYIVQRAMGISLQGEVQVGGAFDKIRNAVANLIEFLLTHVDNIANFFNQFLSNQHILVAFGVFLGGTFLSFILGILGPILLIGAALGAIGYGASIAIEKMGGLNTVIQKAQAIWDTLANFWNTTVLPTITFLGNSLKTLLQPALDALRPALDQLGEAFNKLWPPLKIVLGVILALTGAILTGLVGAFVNALPFFINALTGLVTFITGILNIIVGLFTLNFGQVWEGVKQVFGGIFTFIVNILAQIGAAVLGFIMGVIAFFEMLFNKLIGKSIIPDIVNGILNWFNTLLTKGLDVIGSLVSGIASKFTGLVSSAWSWGSNLVNNFIEGIKSKAAEARKNVVGGLVGKLLSDAGLYSQQHGGIVPGPAGQAIPILAHAGERVVPRSGADVGGFGGGGVTINMNGNISMDTEDRVRQLADRIIAILGRQSELARWGLR